MSDDLILDEGSRAKLDGIVSKMTANSESESDIQFVVNDFKSKYGVKKKDNIGQNLSNGTTVVSPSKSTSQLPSWQKITPQKTTNTIGAFDRKTTQPVVTQPVNKDILGKGTTVNQTIVTPQVENQYDVSAGTKQQADNTDTGLTNVSQQSESKRIAEQAQEVQRQRELANPNSFENIGAQYKSKALNMSGNNEVEKMIKYGDVNGNMDFLSNMLDDNDRPLYETKSAIEKIDKDNKIYEQQFKSGSITQDVYDAHLKENSKKTIELNTQYVQQMQQRNSGIDDEIKQSEAKLARGYDMKMLGAQAYPEQLTKEEIATEKQKIKQLTDLKNDVLVDINNPVKSLEKHDGYQQAEKQGLIPTNASNSQKVKIYSYILVDKAKKLARELGYNPNDVKSLIGDELGSNTPKMMWEQLKSLIVGSNDKEKEYVHTMAELQAIAPIAILNKNNLTLNEGYTSNLVSSFRKSVAPLFVRNQIATDQDRNVLTKEAFNQAGVNDGISQAYTDKQSATEKEAKTLGKTVARTTGDVVGIGVKIALINPILDIPAAAIEGAVGKPILSGLDKALSTSKSAQALEAGELAKLGETATKASELAQIDKAKKVLDIAKVVSEKLPNNFLTRTVYNTTKAGVVHEIQGRVNEELKGFANFEVGAVNHLIGMPLNTLGQVAIRLFGKEAPAFVSNVVHAVQAGTSMTATMAGMTVVNDAKESESFDAFKEKLDEQFGTADKKLRFVAENFLLGLTMHAANISTLSGLFKDNYTKQYDALKPEEKAKMDEFVKSVNEDANDFESETKDAVKEVKNDTHENKTTDEEAKLATDVNIAQGEFGDAKKDEVTPTPIEEQKQEVDDRNIPLKVTDNTDENRKDWSKNDYMAKLGQLRAEQKKDAEKIKNGKDSLSVEQQKELDDSNNFYDKKIKEYHDEFQSRLPDSREEINGTPQQTKKDELKASLKKKTDASKNEPTPIIDEGKNNDNSGGLQSTPKDDNEIQSGNEQGLPDKKEVPVEQKQAEVTPEKKTYVDEVLAKAEQEKKDRKDAEDKIVQLTSAHNSTGKQKVADKESRKALKEEVQKRANELGWSIKERGNGDFDIIDDKGVQRRDKVVLTPEQKQQRKDATAEEKKWNDKISNFDFHDIKNRVLQYIATGGKIHTDDLRDQIIGKDNNTEYKNKQGMHSKSAPHIDGMIEGLLGSMPDVADYDKAREAIIEEFGKHTKASAEKEIMAEIQKQEEAENGAPLNEVDKASFEKYQQEQLQNEQDKANLEEKPLNEHDAEVAQKAYNLELSDQQAQDVSDFFTKFKNEDGDVDWDKALEALDSDFSFELMSLPDAKIKEITKIIEDAKSKREQQDTPTDSENRIGEINIEKNTPDGEQQSASRRQAETEHTTETKRLEDNLAKAKADKKAKTDELEKLNQVEMFGDVPKKGELIAQEKDVSKENKDAILKPFNEAIAKAESDLQKHIDNKDAYIKKYDNQVRVDELQGKDLIGDAFDRIANKLPGGKKNLTEQEKTSIKKDVYDLVTGLVQEGKIQLDKIVDFIKDELRKRKVDDKLIDELTDSIEQNVILNEYVNEAKKEGLSYEEIKAELDKDDIDYDEKDLKDAFDGNKEPANFNDISEKELADADNGEERQIGTKKVINDALYGEMGLKPLELPPRRSGQENLDAGKRMVDSGERNPIELVDYLLSKKDDPNSAQISPNDEPVMLYYRMQLDAKGKELNNAISELQEKVNSDPQDEKSAMDLETVKQQQLLHYDEVERAINASQIGGNVWSKYGNARQTAVNEQGLLINSINRIKAIYGDDMPAKLSEELKVLQQRYDALVSDNEKIQADFIKKTEEAHKAEVDKHILEAYEKGKKEGSAGSRKYSKKAKEVADKFRSFKTKPFEFDDGNGNKIVLTENSILSLNEIIEAGAKIIETTGKIADGISHVIEQVKDTEWYKNMSQNKRDEFEKKIEEQFAHEETKAKDDKGLRVSNSRIKDIIAERKADGKNTTIEDVVAEIKKENPEMSDREIRDAITGYGKTSELKGGDDAIVRKIRRMGRYQSIMEDIENNKRPLRSGIQRDKIEADERAKLKEIYQGLKNLPIDASDLSKQLKTAQDAIVTHLENSIEDLDRQIKTGERPVKNKAIETTPRIEELRKERDRLLKQRNEIDNPPKSDLERLVDKAIDFTNKINQAKKEGKKKDEKALQIQKEATDGSITNLVDAVIKMNINPAEVELARKIKAKENEIAKLEEKLNNNDLSKPESKEGVTSPELDDLTKQKGDLVKELAKRRSAEEQANLHSDTLQELKDNTEISGETKITKADVSNGLISDLVQAHIEKGTPNSDIQKTMFDELKEIFPDTTEAQVRDAILKQGEFASDKKTRTDLQNQVSELKKQLNYNKRIEELQNGIEKETKAKGAQSDEVKALQKQLADVKKESVNKFPNLSSVELERQIKTTQSKIDKGDYFKVPFVKKKWQSNERWIQNNQRLTNLKNKLREHVKDAMESEKSRYMRILDGVNRWGRRVIFFGSNAVYTKLASAAMLGSFAHRIPEQLAGLGYKKLFPRLGNISPESSYNVEAEKKFYEEFLNSKKFIKNTWDIAKTGQTELSKELGHHSNKYHIPIVDLFAADSHIMIKDPVKRATFEATFLNHLKFYSDNNVDYTHPLIMESARQAAYKAAEYEIFQDSGNVVKNNAINIGKYFNEIEKNAIIENKSEVPFEKIGGNLKYTIPFLKNFFIPINTVPLNIVRRVFLPFKIPFLLVKAMSESSKIEKGISELSTQEADVIFRQLKKGTIGAAYWTLGFYIAGQLAGGLYTRFDPDKKRKKGVAKSNELDFLGMDINHNIQHTPQLTALQMGATARVVYNHYVDDKKANAFTATMAATTSLGGAAIDQMPTPRFAKEALNAASNPNDYERFKNNLVRRVGYVKGMNLLKMMGYGDGYVEDEAPFVPTGKPFVGKPYQAKPYTPKPIK